MTTLLENNRVLDAFTWEAIGDRATVRLVAECEAASDGVAPAEIPRHVRLDHEVWDYRAPLAGYANGRPVRIAVPMLTAVSRIGDLSMLATQRGFHVTRMYVDSYGEAVARIELYDGTWADGRDKEAWRAVNLALFAVENGRGLR